MNILELAKTIFIKIFSKIPKLKLLANSKTHYRYCEIWSKIDILQCSLLLPIIPIMCIASTTIHLTVFPIMNTCTCSTASKHLSTTCMLQIEIA